jgi:hypothetical protein
MILPSYKPKKKFMQLAIAEAKRARDRGDLCHRSRHHAAHWKSGSDYRICRQPGKNLGFIHQARGAGNIEICLLRLWPVPTGFRVVFHT